MSRFPDLIRHLRTHSVRTDGPFTLRSGDVSNWYLDARRTTLDGEGARIVGEAVLEVLAPEVVAVGGLTMGADPVSLATALVATSAGRDLRAFSVRKEAKDHGVEGRLVGPVDAGDLVAIAEDTTTTGGALIEALEVAQGAGLEVVQAVAVCDRSGGKVRELLDGRSIPFTALVEPSDLGV